MEHTATGQNIMIFGGTTEGRLLAEFCVSRQIEAYISVTSDYGASLLPESALLHILKEPMSEGQMEACFHRFGIDMVIDATHPYAREVTENIQNACTHMQIARYRVIRETVGVSGGAFYFDTMEQLVSRLKQTTGTIFVTTGSKELSCFLSLPEYASRCIVRVLDEEEIISACLKSGFLPGHIIAGKGPFGMEENITQFKASGAKYLVTKESGSAGGFGEKLAAAQACGMEVLILKRIRETGLFIQEICDILDKNKKWSMSYE